MAAWVHKCCVNCCSWLLVFGLAELPEQLCFTVRLFLSSLFELQALCIIVSSWLAHYDYSILFCIVFS